MQRHADLIGFGVRSQCVRKHYPDLCKALGVEEPPPYKDFAAQLAGDPDKSLLPLLPRRRKENWRQGKRVDVGTFYYVPDPAAAVVELAAAERKRA